MLDEGALDGNAAEVTARPRHPEKAHRPDQPQLRKPDWIRVKAPGSPQFAATNEIVKAHGLVTVCQAVSYTHLTLPTKRIV